MPNKPKRAKPIKTAESPRRAKTAERGYDRRHVKLRAMLLRLFPICQTCQAAFSQHAHHLRYPAETLNDYASLCEACHQKHHIEENQSR